MSAETCRSCGAPVLWRRSEGFGRWAPIDAEPNPAGNVLLLSEGRYRVLGPPSLLEPEPPGLRYMLVPTPSRALPWGQVVASDRASGRLIRCPCGAERWTAFGQAARHGRRCPSALMVLAARAQRAGEHRTASTYRHAALAAALAHAGRRGHTAAVLADALGYSPGHVRALLREAEAAGKAERRGRPPFRWRAKLGKRPRALEPGPT